MSIKRINQSTVKRLSMTNPCPKKFKAENIDHVAERKYTDAMRKGHVFEYLLFETKTREGEIPELFYLKNGNKSTDQIRIEQQVINCQRRFRELGIKIARTDFQVEVNLSNSIVLFCTLDVLVEFEGRPYIVDVKLTGDADTTFGNFKWGEFDSSLADHRGIITATRSEDMDLIQSDTYRFAMKQKTGREWGFMYAVFDYGTRMKHKFIEVPFDPAFEQDMRQRFEVTKQKLEKFEQLGYIAIPSQDQCKECKVENCEKRWVDVPQESRKPVVNPFYRPPAWPYNNVS